MLNPWIFGCGVALIAGSAAYCVIAWVAVSRRLLPEPRVCAELPPVTVIKPLCGAEPETYECLRSFCDQGYPEYQIVFGVADNNDPAVAVVERLRREFPHRHIELVVDRRQHGSSRKVSNLMNMVPLARHEVFVISDSDVRVPSGYLAGVVAPLSDAAVGIVTTPYRGVPRPGLWSVLGAQFINEWFIPSVRVAAMGGSRAFAFGATIAIRREVLTRIGGFSAIANQLADDYRLGELTRRLGLRTVLSDVVVDTSVTEGSLAELVRHELRWLRTIRAVRPWGYAMSFITFGMPVAMLGAVMAGGGVAAGVLLAVAAAARLLLHFKTRTDDSSLLHVLVLPLRDLLSVALWSWGFVNRRVHWRNHHYRVARDGSVLPVARAS